MKKNLLKILLIPFAAVALSGCYTVMWMPDQSSSDYQDQQNQNDYYYPESYYGDYYTYYDSPWWRPVVEQTSGSGPYVRDTNKSIQFIRNIGDRGGSKRGGGLAVPLPTTRPEPILTTSPSTTTTNTGNSSGGKVESSNSSGSSSNRSGSSNNDNNRPARNDNGRNTNGRN